MQLPILNTTIMVKKMNWSAEADLKMLLFIIQSADIKIDHAAVAKHLSDDEITLTPKAIKEHWRKLKTTPVGSEAINNDNTNSDNDESTITVKNTKKRATNGGTDTKLKKARKGKAVKVEVSDEDEAYAIVPGMLENTEEEIN